MKLKVLSLFAGIGGFDLGLERTGGFETAAFCEIDEKCRKVLSKHWPKVPQYDDVRTLTGARLAADGIAVDCIAGGFPCQDISLAGGRRGMEEGTRSGLWSEFARLVGEIRPAYAIVENVTNLLVGPGERPGGWFGRVLGDLAGLGYDAEWHSIGAAYAGVPQRRPRVWVIAYPPRGHSDPLFHPDPKHVESYRSWLDGPSGENAYPYDENRGACALSVLGNTEWASIPKRERSGNNERLSVGVDRYKQLGNAVVPQIPELLGYAILDMIAASNGIEYIPKCAGTLAPNGTAPGRAARSLHFEPPPCDNGG